MKVVVPIMPSLAILVFLNGRLGVAGILFFSGLMSGWVEDEKHPTCQTA